MTYQPKTYRDQGGDRQVIAKGGTLLAETGAAVIFPNPSGAQDYFVDGNVSASGDGLSWATAFKTLSEAIAASNISIALTANRWWARRNRIFACGDEELTENLTVLPEKCDIIGTGYDILAMPRLTGNHTIAAATKGTRFINMGFMDPSGTADLFVIPAGCHGLAFIGCHFHPKATGSTGKALEITNSSSVRIQDCTFDVRGGSMTGIFALAISLEGTVLHDVKITDNHITATLGIAVVEAAAVAMGSLIARNTIRSTGIAIDDNSDDFQVVDNRWMTDVDTTTSTAGYDFNLQLAAGNIQMGVNGLCDTVPFTKIAE
jgi:hypothetical protein